MTRNDRALFSDLLGSLNPAPTNDDIWRGSPFDVPELHHASTKEILLGVNSAGHSANGNPLGVAVLGKVGAGKTHLLGAIRERIQRESLGYFFLVSLNDGKAFWPSTAIGMADGFRHDSLGWGTQHKTFFRRLTAELPVDQDVRNAIAGDSQLTRDHLDTFIKALRDHDPNVGRDCQHTARALALQGSTDYDAQDIGDIYLQSQVVDEAARTTWGLPAVAKTPQEIVRDISRLIALTRSPAVIAFDQLDLLFEHSLGTAFGADGAADDPSLLQVSSVAQGLIDLREKTQRSLIVLSCLPDTWTLLSNNAPASFAERFRVTHLPDRIKDADLGRRLVALRFAPTLAHHKVTPTYPTWPIADTAFPNPLDLSPRQLLRRVNTHLESCLVNETFGELKQLTERVQTEDKSPDVPEAALVALDSRFAELVATVDVADAFDPKREDQLIPELLRAGLEAWITEQASPGRFKQDIQHGGQPAVHARLIEVLDEDNEREASWCFRAIASPTANAVISRVQKACTKSGIAAGLPNRHMVFLREAAWPTGKRTEEITQAAADAGAVRVPVGDHDLDHDLRTYAALKELLLEDDPDLRAWLTDRRPASATELFRASLPDVAKLVAPPANHSQRTHREAASRPNESSGPPTSTTSDVFLGRRVANGDAFALGLESLRKHTVIFAGSGSGKTVLIRRMIEECALQGVSSIVLDINNDLARLSEPWPEPPETGWDANDAQRAEDYLAHTDVVIWTPRITAGRPLAFQPLPDFGPVLDSQDEFNLAVEAAVEALANRVGAGGPAEKAKKRKAVLTEGMRAYARTRTTTLTGFADFLADLPDGLSQLRNGQKIAHEIAEALKAEMITNPLLGGHGTAADPGVLLTPAPGKRARVCVISMVGLTSPDQQQGFVNQLQMAVFSWIKQHPAKDRPLGALLVIDEAQNFAPTTGGTPSTMSTVLLAQQARKYGLGLVFATQAPKGIHNQISGNATTQFFGRLSVPAQITAAKEVAAAKGATIPDIGNLKHGQFYAANDEDSFERIDTLLCLSYHGSPLTREEVIARACAGPGSPV